MQSSDPSAPRSGVERQTQVRRIFSEIAPRYDLLNHVLSLNIDRAWRHKAVDRLGWEARKGGLFLDACAGTYDLALELAHRAGFHGRVVASDFAQPMLVQGAGKVATLPVRPVCGDSLHLPFRDGCFDGATVGFGVRNLSDLAVGICELNRVLKPGARLVVLEFTLPPNPFLRAGYLAYFRFVLPFVGRVVSGHPWAYAYLPASVREFPGPEEFADLFRSCGFVEVGWKLLTGGIAALHWGTAAG